jgi:primosomal protein N' (replication factor Y)
MLFAEVVIDTTTRELGERLFTYNVPEHLRQEVFVGTQVLVPFGNQDLVAGYVVGLHDDINKTQYGADRPDSERGTLPRTRPIAEVLEGEPLFDRNYISLLHWVAEYYAASIAEVISAAVPADIGPRSKRVARLAEGVELNGATSATTHGTGLFGALPRPLSPQEQTVLAALKGVKGKSIAVKTLKQRTALAQSKFYTALTELRRAGIVIVENESDSKAGPKTVSCVMVAGGPPKTKKQEELVTFISRAGGQIPMAELIRSAGTTHATVKKACADGVLAMVQEEVIRDPLLGLASRAKSEPPPALTDHQQVAYDTLRSELFRLFSASAGLESEDSASTSSPVESGPWLLHGVTGSGKTEIYMRLISDALAAGRNALMLVPEISLTPQLAQRLVGRFGDQVAVWHSALSPGERFDTWRRLRAGQARVLLGARSAILAGMPDVGIIILDEEHDGSYKQSTPSPRYHARTVATERARREGALLLLGSATPDIGTFFECQSSGRIVALPERVFKQALPKSTLVDMREEFIMGNKGIFSNALERAMAERLKRQEQIILLINRRGYASHVFCRACGYVVRCRNCSVSLVYHQPTPARSATRDQTFGASPGQTATALPEGVLVCHHCAFTTNAWQICPACQSPFIKQFGLGTQRVEEEVRERFPSARILRLDSDITSRKGAYEEIFESFASGGADILIGTQIVAKGLDIARVTLVGVMAADASFNLPDYRTMERGFQLLTQVSGRAGRGAHAGEVILQTYNLDLPALALARSQDFSRFAESELESRREFEYPPFSQIIRCVISGDTLELVEATSEQLAEELSSFLEPEFTEDDVKILGPAPCIIDRLRGKYRHHIIIKNLAGDRGRTAITSFLKSRRPQGIVLGIDVDAVDLV